MQVPKEESMLREQKNNKIRKRERENKKRTKKERYEHDTKEEDKSTYRMILS